MQFDIFPMYCGGTILKGLYNQKLTYQGGTMVPLTEKALIDHLISKKRMGALVRPSGENDPFPFVPATLIQFQRILKLLIANGYSNLVGAIFAVTNPSQNIAKSHLKASGFTLIQKTYKMSGPEYQTPESIERSGCENWFGDVHGKILPILKNVPDLMNHNFEYIPLPDEKK